MLRQAIKKATKVYKKKCNLKVLLPMAFLNKEGTHAKISPAKIDFVCTGKEEKRKLKILLKIKTPIKTPKKKGKRNLAFSLIFLKKFKKLSNNFS